MYFAYSDWYPTCHFAFNYVDKIGFLQLKANLLGRVEDALLPILKKLRKQLVLAVVGLRVYFDTFFATEHRYIFFIKKKLFSAPLYLIDTLTSQSQIEIQL